MSPFVVALSVALLLGLTAVALRRLRFDPGTIAIVLAGLVLYCVYLSYTEYNTRNYDGPDQVRYIEYIAAHRALPPASHCFICYHPPVYYVLAAGVYAFFKAVPLVRPILGLQLFSLVLSTLFVVFGALTARLILSDRRQIRLATALIILWPYSVHNSVRVHNDTLVSLWTAIGLYLLVRFHREGRPRHLYQAAVVAVLAVFTKSSGYGLVAALFGVIALRLAASRDKLRLLRRAGAVALFVAAAVALGRLARGAGPDATGDLCQRLLGPACKMAKSYRLGQGPYNYLYFDIPGFLKHPYVLTYSDVGGRQLFWNHLVESSLFGTHNTSPDVQTTYAFNRRIATVMSGILIGMIGFIFAGAASLRRQLVRRHGALLITLSALLASLLSFRVLAPAPHHTDFRHIFAALIPVSIFYAAAVGHFRRNRPLLGRAGHVLAVAFLALTALYFLPKYDLVMRWSKRTISKQLSELSRIVPERTPWDRNTTLRIEGNETVEITVPGGAAVSFIDVTLDSNDVYEILLIGRHETRKILLGPHPARRGGMGRYQQEVAPPVADVQRIRVRPVSGDMAYSIGHLLIE